MSAKASGHFRHLDFKRMDEFTGQMGKNISRLNEDVIAQVREHSMEVIDEYSQQDPEFSGRVAVGADQNQFQLDTRWVGRSENASEVVQ